MNHIVRLILLTAAVTLAAPPLAALADKPTYRDFTDDDDRSNVREYRSDADHADRSGHRGHWRKYPKRDHRGHRRDHTVHRYRHHPVGHYTRSLSGSRIRIDYRHGSLYYSRGHFYRPRLGGYVVVTAPIGAVIPGLSNGYVTFRVGGRDYYELGDTYYVRDNRGYRVVEKPQRTAKRDRVDNLLFYPERGQTLEDEGGDRRDCHNWALGRTGLSADEAAMDEDLRQEYLSALGQCMGQRGYSVR